MFLNGQSTGYSVIRMSWTRQSVLQQQLSLHPRRRRRRQHHHSTRMALDVSNITNPLCSYPLFSTVTIDVHSLNRGSLSRFFQTEISCQLAYSCKGVPLEIPPLFFCFYIWSESGATDYGRATCGGVKAVTILYRSNPGTPLAQIGAGLNVFVVITTASWRSGLCCDVVVSACTKPLRW